MGFFCQLICWDLLILEGSQKGERDHSLQWVGTLPLQSETQTLEHGAHEHNTKGARNEEKTLKKWGKEQREQDVPAVFALTRAMRDVPTAEMAIGNTMPR